MWQWIVKNKWPLFLGALGLLAGFLLNKWANKISEDRIISELTAEIESLKNKRLTTGEQQRLTGLQAQLNLLKTL